MGQNPSMLKYNGPTPDIAIIDKLQEQTENAFDRIIDKFYNESEFTLENGFFCLLEQIIKEGETDLSMGLIKFLERGFEKFFSETERNLVEDINCRTLHAKVEIMRQTHGFKERYMKEMMKISLLFASREENYSRMCTEMNPQRYLNLIRYYAR